MNPLAKEEYWISASKIGTSIACPYKLYLNLCHIDPTHFDNKYTSSGTAVHQYAEDFFTDKVNPDMNYYYDALYVPLDEDGGHIERDKQIVPAEMYPRVDQCIQNLVKWFNGNSYQCEVPFKKELTTPRGRKVVLNGFIDAMNDEELIDWKTGSDVDKIAYRIQGAIYDFVTDFTRKVTFISLLNGTRMEIKHASKTYVPALCDQYIDVIEGHNFERNRQFLCKYCEFKDDRCYDGAEYVFDQFEIKELVKKARS